VLTRTELRDYGNRAADYNARYISVDENTDFKHYNTYSPLSVNVYYNV
jgi:hypothetical protein